eukprot:NODE_2327_length_1210_cov_40.384118_g2213_i0.p1 GENE.NODE_2327_length_1210_cov_40.384118_g2213_i0~~NODE_2327_length_1210_cov_40.384118_g2213_i0.p1  ORF type:complete len:368 (+),score=98.38 NODE_2327_length_1210_cov_40.384118_g2213_i0:3-1106(+)
MGVYYGPAKTAISYFAGLGHPCPQYSNPCDFFMKLLRTESVEDPSLKTSAASTAEQFIQFWTTHGSAVQVTSGRQCKGPSVRPAKPAPFGVQLVALIRRTLVSVFRQPMLTRVRLFQTLFLGLLLGAIYFDLGNDQQSIQMRQGLIFFTLVNQSFTPLLGVLHVFPTVSRIVMREHNSGLYGIPAYFLATLVGLLPNQIIFPILFTTIVYWMAGLAAAATKYLIYTAFILLISNSAQSFGLWVSASVPNIGAALALGPLAMVLSLVFGGFVTNRNSVQEWLKWATYASFVYWPFEACIKNEFEGRTFTCDVSTTLQGSCFRTGDQVIESMGFREASLWVNALVSFAFTCGALLLTFLTLMYKAHRHR